MKLTKKDIDELYLVDLRLKAKAWSIGKLEYKLHSAQRKIYETVRNTSQREVVILCARRFGKSYLGCVMAIEDCLRNPSIQVRIIAPDIKQATAIVVPLINKIAKDAPSGLIQRTKSEHKWVVGKSELILGGFDSTNIESHRGSESYAIYIEESGVANPDQYIYAMNDVLKPQLLHTRGKIVHLTTPPKELDHPFTTDTCVEAVYNSAFFKYTIHDNPLLDDQQIGQAIKDCGGVQTTSFRREYLCEIVKDETSLVIPDFDASIHVREFELPEHSIYIDSIDFGGTQDKTACLLMTHDFKTGTDLIWDEREHPLNTSSKTIIDSLRDMEAGKVKDENRYGDSSGMTRIDAMQEHNFYFQMPYKDDLDAGINMLRLRFNERTSTGQPKILVHPRCKFLILSLNNGQYNKQRTDLARTKALGHCDAIMALVYGNRMLDRTTNPYPSPTYNRETNFTANLKLTEKSELVTLATKIQTKRFGTFRG